MDMEDMRKVLLEAISIASRRKGVWQEVKKTAEKALRLFELNPSLEAWVDAERPKKWLGRVLRTAFVVEDQIVELLATLIGEARLAVQGASYEVRTLCGAEVVRAYEAFHDYAGLRSCVSARPHLAELFAINPEKVALAAAYRAGHPRARALLWRAKTPEGGEVLFLDRVYASEEAARKALKEWALEQGAYVKTADSWTVLGNTEDGAKVTAVNRCGEEQEDLRVLLRVQKGIHLPFMDTFAFAVRTPEGLELRTRCPEDRRYVFLREADGVPIEEIL